MALRWLGLGPGDSLGGALGRYRGVGPGFDLLRLGLALVIFCGHAKWASGGWGMEMTQVAQLVAPPHLGFGAAPEPVHWAGPLRPIKLALVPMFFALSGFLVMGSAIRLRATSTFLAHRALRIFPALIIEVTLSALVLGPFLTTLSTAAYFHDSMLWRYLGNIVGWISFELPGVFSNVPRRNLVNVSLWTLPAEFYCYLLLASCMITRIAYHRTIFTALIAIGTTFLAARHGLTGASTALGPYPTHVIVYYFSFGALAYHWRDHIPANFVIFLGSIILSYGLLMYDWTTYLIPLPLVYATVFFGLFPIPRFRLFKSGDYSYGIYLYGFPITQALLQISPMTFVQHPFRLIPAALGLTIALAVISWRMIERHSLAMKSRLPARYFPTTNSSAQFELKRPVIDVAIRTGIAE